MSLVMVRRCRCCRAAGGRIWSVWPVMGGWCQFDDLTAVNSTKFSIERVSKNHCPEYLKGIRGVAEYVTGWLISPR
ncbi:hypothetical protein KCQ64_29365, partial [Klebsiella pneumoniae]|nr:hypothetical protein [Klebsiella pneumoniae]